MPRWGHKNGGMRCDPNNVLTEHLKVIKMTSNVVKPVLLFAIVLLAIATWINEIAIADMMFFFDDF